MGVRRAVFLDRDGVLNETFVRDGKPYPPSDLAQFRILPGVEEACRVLREHGFRLIVVTNQPDIARGTTSAARVELLNEELRRQVALDEVMVCPHDDSDGCTCRKPRPGMLLEAAARHDIDLAASFMVGDRDRDIEAGQAAGCRTVFVDGGYGRRPDPPADLTVASLREAVPWLIDALREE
jgi:D-glycero-D-manno-heptose 1,7-bisphosphate phosphatase